jgi:hypothetical protein
MIGQRASLALAKEVEIRTRQSRRAAMKCTRCRDANGVPTGTVRGGECFQCHGTGERPQSSPVSVAEREAGKRRMAAINALRAAGITWKQQAARSDLEELEPERHLRLIDSVLAGRTSAVLAALDAYYSKNIRHGR